MKLLITAFFLITTYLSFGQANSDTIIFVNGDSLVICRGLVSAEPKIKGNTPINELIYIKAALLREQEPSIGNTTKPRFIEFIIDTLGIPRNIKIIGRLSSFSDKDLIEFVKTTSWHPAIDTKGKAVNRIVTVIF